MAASIFPETASNAASSKAARNIAFRWAMVPNRVTRLGEFSHFGLLFTLGSGLKIILVSSANLGANFFTRLCINFTQNWLGFFLGGLFTNSSGANPTIVLQRQRCKNLPRHE
jgi:hypothetical protein